MTDTQMAQAVPMTGIAEKVGAHLKRRHAAEQRFKAYGIASIVMAVTFLAILMTSIIGRGASAFVQSEMQLTVTFDGSVIDPDGTHTRAVLNAADYAALVRTSITSLFPETADNRAAKRELMSLVSTGAEEVIRKMVIADPTLIGQTRTLWVPVAASVDQMIKGHRSRSAENGGQFSDRQLTWIDAMTAKGLIKTHFNTWLWTQGDSRQPELAGLWGAVVGSFFSLVITLLLSFPLGVATAIYLEEFAGENRWTDLIEVNINNLAAVPSIVFGLLALEMFLNVFGLPRSAPFVGGLALTLVSLPTIIIASRVALKAVPPWIREAALGLGASRLQMVIHHVLPLAMPGILTGTIIGMARAVGESAPLLMIGMVAFIVDIPATPMDPSTALPVQIYLWAASPERAFVERTSAAIIVLLLFLACMNAGAIYLRKKFERRW